MPRIPGRDRDREGPLESGTARVRESLAEVRRRRRQHRRDLPARIRRRQAAAAAAAGALVLFGGWALFAGGDDGDDERRLAVKKLVGQTIVAKMPKNGPDQNLLLRARRGQISGVIVVAGTSEEQLPGYLDRLQQAASQGGNPLLLVMIDQEGGSSEEGGVKRLPGPPATSPAELGDSGTADESRAAGEATGEYLAGLGVNIDLAPVLDVERDNTADTLAPRTFGDDPDNVADLGVAFAEGLRAGGVAATAKHFPGLGLSTFNTDFSGAEIAAPGSAYEEALVPFRAAISAGVDLVMVSSAIYPNYDENNLAMASKKVSRGLLRGRLGFEGVSITDDLEAIAVKEFFQQGPAARRSMAAGMDLLLYASSGGGSVKGFNALVRAVKRGEVKRERLEIAYDRIQELKEKIANAAAAPPGA